MKMEKRLTAVDYIRIQREKEKKAEDSITKCRKCNVKPKWDWEQESMMTYYMLYCTCCGKKTSYDSDKVEACKEWNKIS